MSNYTKSTNFATKDNLSPGDPLKIVRGTEIDTEFNNISTAISTKTDNSAAAITGGSITGITDLAIADGGTGASTATAAINNLLPAQTSAANKYLQSDGTNVSWDAVSLSTADITGTLGAANGGTGVSNNAAMTVTGSGNFAYTRTLTGTTNVTFPTTGTLATLAGTETLTNKTLTSPILTTPTLGVATGTSFQGIIGNVTPAAGAFTTVTASTAIGTASGGTGLGGATPFTSGGVVYASSTSALATGSALTFNGTSFGVGSSSYGDAGTITASIGVPATTIGGLQLWSTTTGTSFVQFGDGTSGAATYAGAIGYNHTSDRMDFYSAATLGMSLTSTGLGIGTSSPSFKLDVSGSNAQSIRVTSNNGDVASLVMNSTGNASWSLVSDTVMRFKKDSSEYMRIDGSGIVTMSAYGAGAATFSASGVISSVSDETWKVKDGVPTNPDAMLKKLEPGYWYYNDEKKETFGSDRQLGFYAQNVNAAIGPEAAPEPEEGKPWGYYDRSVLAVTVMSLQKALLTIESLKARLDAANL